MLAHSSVSDIFELARALPEAAFLLDLGGEVLAANDPGSRMLGLSAENLRGKRLCELVDDPPEKTDRYLRACSRSGSPIPGLLTFKGCDGDCNCYGSAVRSEAGVSATLIFLRCKPKGTHTFLALNNELEALRNAYCRVSAEITEHERAEEISSRLAAIVESSNDAIIGKTLEGIITSWNKGAERIYGYSPQETIGRPISILVPSDRSDEIPAILQKIRHGEPVDHYETIRIKKDGARIHVSVTVSPVRDSGGKIIGASATARDITERKQAEEEIHNLNQQLEERVRKRTTQLEEAYKELESFSYSVSHDLRAPIRHIDGYARMLQRRLEPSLDETSLRYLRTITESTQRAGNLIDDLLSFSRMSRAEIHNILIDMNQLVREALIELRFETSKRNIDWKIEELPEVCGDPSMLRLVWRNLLSNAVKYTLPREQATIEVGGMGVGDGAIFFVRDNGVGFDMQYADRLFGVFQRLHSTEEFEGTGIGLANVRRIVGRHGGHTWAEGYIGSGATFYFSLPLVAEKNNGRPG